METTKLQLRALHEAAHAVASESFGWSVKEVVLEETRGVVQSLPSTINGWTEASHPYPKLETIGFYVAVAICGYARIRRVNCSTEMMQDAVSSVGLDWHTIEGYFNNLKLEPGMKLASLYDGVAEAESVINENEKAIDRIATVPRTKSPNQR